MSLDEILKTNAGKLPKGLINTSGEPERISTGQLNYLLGLSRDYLPDGHSKAYSEKDVMFDVLRQYNHEHLIQQARGKEFRLLTKKEARVLIDWLLRKLGREPQFETG